MKTLLTLLTAFLLTLNTYAQTVDHKPLPQTTFNINPLGLLQFGPIFQGEFRVNQKGYFTPHVRIPYLGVLYHVITRDDWSDDVTVSPVALGVGAGYKILFPVRSGAWYAGGTGEYSFGSSKGNDGSDWESKFSNVAIMANGGFRWRPLNRKAVLSLGAYLGCTVPVRDEWWYVSSPQVKRDEKQFLPMLMLELSFGWER